VVSLAYEVYNSELKKGDSVLLTDYEGNPLQEAQVLKGIAKKAAGFRVQREEASPPVAKPTADRIPDDAIVCRCERVTAGEIRRWIRKGIRDMNQIKAITRAGMGACGSKTCGDLIVQLFKG